MDTVSCKPCCAETQSVNVPGIEGDDGSDGQDGQNAYTKTTSQFTVPAIGDPVTISVQSSLWMAIGETIVVDGPATFQVVSLPSSTTAALTFLGYPGDVAPGTVIKIVAGLFVPATVTPTGVLSGASFPDFAANMGNSDQTAVVTATPTPLEFDTEVFDSEGDYDTTTYTFTPSAAGIYLFTISAALKALTDQKTVSVLLYKNGVEIARATTTSSFTSTVQAQLNFRSAANGTTDAFIAYVLHNKGSNADVDGSNTLTFFQANYAGPI